VNGPGRLTYDEGTKHRPDGDKRMTTSRSPRSRRRKIEKNRRRQPEKKGVPVTLRKVLGHGGLGVWGHLIGLCPAGQRDGLVLDRGGRKEGDGPARASLLKAAFKDKGRRARFWLAACFSGT